MPHLILSSYSPPSLPTTYDDVEFLWRAKGEKKELWGTAVGQNAYLFNVVPHTHGVLVKSDKLTRSSDIEELKRVLRTFARVTNATVYADNIPSKNRPPLADSQMAPDAACAGYPWPSRVALEIGFGSGRHLLWRAKESPEILFIGVEIHKPSLEQLLKQCHLQGITNVRAVDYDANLFLETLPDGLLETIYLHFPIPWIKSPGRNIFCWQLVDEARRVLKPGGTLELRTDDRWYLGWALEILADTPHAFFEVAKDRNIEVMSKYEARWRRQGKEIADVIYYNTHPVASKRELRSMSFDCELSFTEVVRRLAAFKPVIGPDYLLKVGSAYTIDATSGLIPLIMGSMMRPEKRYLLIHGGNLSYYPTPPLCTRAGYQAHRKLLEIVKGEANEFDSSY
ncbi:MAG: methyltransferase domain-containing protein [Campylobacterales bacterium]